MTFYTIRGRMTFFSILMITLILVGRTVYAIQSEVLKADQQIEERLVGVLSLGSSALSVPVWDNNEDDMNKVLDLFVTDPHIVKVQLLDPEQRRMLSKEKVGKVKVESKVLMKDRRIYYEGKYVATIQVWMSREIYDMKMYREILLATMFSFFEISILGSVIWIISKKITRPVADLIQIAENISRGNLDNHFNKHGNDEIGKLSIALELMQTQIFEQINSLENDRTEISALYEETTAMNEELGYMLDLVNKSYEDTIKSLANAIEASDEYTKGHCDRVETYALQIGEALDLSRTHLENLSKASILHDIGKIGIPTEILNKETPLTDLEFNKIKEHSHLGYQILKEVEFLKNSVEVIRQHHERYDGYGYPDGRSGDEIDMLARILSIADSYDAMTSSRAYRKKPLSPEKAMEELRQGSGKQFDPEIVEVFIRCVTNEEV